MSHHTEEEWARSLIERDWEIFWDSDGGDLTHDKATAASITNEVISDIPSSSVQGDIERAAAQQRTVATSDDDDENEENEAEPSDWYDGFIISAKKCVEGQFLFFIKFVGDDQIYDMTLKRELVRPSARAWIRRTRVILFPSIEFNILENRLPADTMTLDDVPAMMRLQRIHDATNTELAYAGNGGIIDEEGAVTRPLKQDFIQVKLLIFHLQAQLYLRTKLAPITDHGDRGLDDPTEAYVNHLVACLDQLYNASIWYKKCFILHQQIFGSGENSSLADVTSLQESYIEDGRVQLTKLVAMDATHRGSKRKPTNVPCGSRKTKRRRIPKETGFGPSKGALGSPDSPDEDQFSIVTEGQFINDKCIQNIAAKIVENDTRWFQKIFAEMLRSTSFHIQEPIIRWKRQAETVLGDYTTIVKEQSETETCGEICITKEDSDSVRSISEEQDGEERFFSFEDVNSCYKQYLNHQVLRGCDLSNLASRLKIKLESIQSFENQAWKLISCLVQEPKEGALKKEDEILIALRGLKHAAENNNQYTNIDPLGSSRCSKMNRAVLLDAIAVREWVVDLRHCVNSRERVPFVQGVVSRAPNLPQIPSPPNSPDGEDSVPMRLAKVMVDVQKVSSSLYANLHVFTKFERLVAESCTSAADPESLRSIEGISQAFNHIRSIPVLSIVEEKLAVRLDIINWKIRAERQLSFGPPYEYSIIEELYKELVRILAGENQTRIDLLTRLETNQSVDKEIRAFAAFDATMLARVAECQVKELFNCSHEWKKRADSIVSALRVHGNLLVGSPMLSTKTAAMVDLKRIDDLLLEYPKLNITLSNELEIILRVQREAKEWSWKVSDVINGKNNLYTNLVKAREQRPKGLMMEPTRHVVDSWIEALDWQNRVTTTLHLFLVEDIDLSTFYPLILEGMDVVVAFSCSHETSDDRRFVVNPENSIKHITALMDSHRQLRQLSKAKLETTELGKIIFSRLLDDDNNEHALLCLAFILWRIEILDLLENCKCTGQEKSPCRPTLLSAKGLLNAQPCVSVTRSDEYLVFLRFIRKIPSSELESYKTLIDDAEKVEATARMILAATKELTRGSYKNTDSLRQNFLHLKEIQSNFKARSQSGPGFVLNIDLEQQLDQFIKDLSWLIKTLSYPVLHFDDANLESLTKSSTLPWDVLVTLFERIPASADDGNPTDIARVALRVRELHDSASSWQEEVTQLLALSFRGSKRRAPVGSPCKLSFLNEPEAQEQIDLSKLADLARNSILTMVSMPREAAVREVLENVHAFEIELHNLLGEDFAISATDKAPYPDSDSLVGDNGDFHLYRLTGSPLFEELLSATRRIEKIANDIYADTPGKAVFEWIRRAMQWVKSLNDSVVGESSFGSIKTLSIPAIKAHQILIDGNTLFLDGISDGVRKTLSSHRIFVTTNKQTNKLTVLIGKGGAHHSMGGTCLKWCALLHDWLKEDVSRMLEWESRCTLQTENYPLSQADASMDEEAIYQLYRFREETERLIDEGRNSLVVTPHIGLIDELLAMNTKIDQQVEICVNSSNGIITLENLRRRRYEDGHLAVDEREDVLMDLLNRRRIQPQSRGLSSTQSTVDTTSRDKARSILEKALIKGMKMMGIIQLNATDVALLCTLKAFDLESATFYKNKDSQADYRDKVISLRSNIEDVRNPTVAARYLLSILSAEALVAMTPEDMVIPHVRHVKAAAEEERTKNLVIAPATISNSPIGNGSVKNILKAAMRSLSETLPVVTKQPETPPQDEVDCMSQFVPSKKTISHTPPPISHTPPPLALLALSTHKDDNADFDVSTSNLSPLSPNSTSPGIASRLRKLSSMPPPPPPLGNSGAFSPSTAQIRQGIVASASGSEKFSFSVNGNTFRGKLLYEGDSLSHIRSGFLPDTFSERGRLSIPEFQKFIRQKIDGGRWTVVSLRLSVTSESDAYKGFYKDYEAKMRIVMFAVGKETKMFLVTPRFHKDAHSLTGTFTNKTSTYAVLLTREQFFE